MNILINLYLMFSFLWMLSIVGILLYEDFGPRRPWDHQKMGKNYKNPLMYLYCLVHLPVLNLIVIGFYIKFCFDLKK